MRGLGGPFWRLFGTGSVSSLADGVVRVALPLLAATLTRDPLLVSALTTFAFLPWLLFGLVSGAVVDRVDRRQAMAVANVLRAVALSLLTLAVALDVAGIGLVYAVAFGLGAAATVHDSAARAALPQVVRRDQLESGNSLIAAEEVVGESFLGAPLGAALFAVAVTAPLAGTAGGYLLAAGLVLTVRRDLRPARTARTSLRRDIRDGVGWLLRHRLLRRLTALTAVLAFGLYMTYGVLVLYALDTLGLSAAGYGLLLALGGVGAVLGGLTAPWLRTRLGRGGGLVAAAAVSALATLCLGLTATPALAVVLFAVAALAGTVWDVLTVSLRQALVPEELFGRVQGSYRTAVWGAIPLGAAAGGLLAAATTVPVVFVVGGTVELLAGAALSAVVRAEHADLDGDLVPDAPA